MKEQSKASFCSVKDYTLEYGHNGKHVRIIRTRFDDSENSTIQFLLVTIDLNKPKINVPRLILPEEVLRIFKSYNPDVSESHVQQFIKGIL